MTVHARQSLVLFCPLALAGLPGRADAHMAMTGLGPMFDAFDAVALDIENAIPLGILGLFLGLRGAAIARSSSLAAMAGWALGGATAMLAGGGVFDVIRPLTAPLLMLAVGSCLAANAALPRTICMALACLIGFARALCGAPDRLTLEQQGSAVAFGALVAFLLVCLAASLTLPLRTQWSIIAARISGSWTAALGLILLGWFLRAVEAGLAAP